MFYLFFYIFLMPTASPVTEVVLKKGISSVPHSHPTSRRQGSMDGINIEAIEKVYSMMEKNSVEIVDMRFVDLFGLWQHISITRSQMEYSDLKLSIWVDGLGFDGSSIRGFQKIHESDMVIIPDPTTAFIDPISNISTVVLNCDIFDPSTKMPYSKDSRFVAKKAEEYLKSTGIATTSYWGPEAEFFIFDHASFDQNVHEGYYHLDSEEGAWNSGDNSKPNLAYKTGGKAGYFPCAPHDTLQDLRGEIVLTLQKCGINVEVHHHEVATAGQCEIDMKFTTLTSMADKLLIYKYIVKNVARKNGKVATFMPKPLYGDNGSGMHVHQSLWNDVNNLFHDADGYAGLSQMAKWYIGGLLKHAHALMAFCAPTTNSYRRLTPGYEAPVNLVYGMRNRSAACRIPMISENPRAKRIEFRPPDPMCNPYLAFSALLMAGLDGIINKIEPGDPIEINTYVDNELSLPTVPSSLDQSLAALKADHEFLLHGDVFTKDLLVSYMEKLEDDINNVRLRPHPAEFMMYFDM